MKKKMDSGTPVIIGLICGIIIIFIMHQYSKSKAVEEALKYEVERLKALKRTQTLQEAYSLTPAEFEELIGQLFKKMGYRVAATKSIGDEGVDLYLYKEELIELVQCKRYKGNVSVQTVREFFGVLVDKNATKGYIITTGHFTIPARQFAGGKAIHLIDGPELAQLLMSIDLGNGGKNYHQD